MSKNFYDKECKYPIKCFRDPCYRTGDFYKISYLNRGIIDETSSCDYLDSLNAVVNRSAGKTIYFVDSLNNELILTPIKMERYIASGMLLFYFEDVARNTTLVYDGSAYLANIDELSYDYGIHLVSYSFVSNYADKDNAINPSLYTNVQPLTDEEKEIVSKRMYEDPFYKMEEYNKADSIEI